MQCVIALGRKSPFLVREPFFRPCHNGRGFAGLVQQLRAKTPLAEERDHRDDASAAKRPRLSEPEASSSIVAAIAQVGQLKSPTLRADWQPPSRKGFQVACCVEAVACWIVLVTLSFWRWASIVIIAIMNFAVVVFIEILAWSSDRCCGRFAVVLVALHWQGASPDCAAGLGEGGPGARAPGKSLCSEGRGPSRGPRVAASSATGADAAPSALLQVRAAEAPHADGLGPRSWGQRPSAVAIEIAAPPGRRRRRRCHFPVHSMVESPCRRCRSQCCSWPCSCVCVPRYRQCPR